MTSVSAASFSDLLAADEEIAADFYDLQSDEVALQDGYYDWNTYFSDSSSCFVEEVALICFVVAVVSTLFSFEMQ